MLERSDFGRPSLEEMADKVCSSLTRETKRVKLRKEEVGDLVLPVDEPLPIRQWRMGRVVKVVHKGDGLVPTVEVTTGASIALVRSIQKLCLLEESRNLSFSLDALIILHFFSILHS